MKFEIAKYYQHEGGRRIAIAPQSVLTVIWGPCLYIEAYDNNGYEPSLVAIDTMPDLPEGEWVEISKNEYHDNFVFVPCEGCGKWIEKGANYLKTDEGFYHAGPLPEHPSCYSDTMKGLPHDEGRIITEEHGRRPGTDA